MVRERSWRRIFKMEKTDVVSFSPISSRLSKVFLNLKSHCSRCTACDYLSTQIPRYPCLTYSLSPTPLSTPGRCRPSLTCVARFQQLRTPKNIGPQRVVYLRLPLSNATPNAAPSSESARERLVGAFLQSTHYT